MWRKKNTAIFVFAALKLTTSKHTEKKTQRQIGNLKLPCQNAQQRARPIMY